MPIIAVISKNNCQFDDLETYVLPLLYQYHDETTRLQLKNKLNDYLWEIIEPYVTFINCQSDTFMETICTHLVKEFPDKNLDEFFYHTESSFSFPKKHTELMYCQPTWSHQKDQKVNMNFIGCLFSLKHNVIENTCVVLANNYDISSQNNIVVGDVTKNDILRMIKRRYFFSAELIKNDTITKYYYQNPGYLVSKLFDLKEQDTIEKLTVGFLKYNLSFYCNQNKNQYVNKIATRINGLYQLYGDVLVLNEMDEHVYTNLSTHELRRLNVLAYGRLYDRQLKADEIHEESHFEVDEQGKEIEKKKTPLWSKYIIIDKRMSEWQNNKNKCFYCNKNIEKHVTCDKCFRIKYCSVKCQSEYNNYHSDDCINPKSITN